MAAIIPPLIAFVVHVLPAINVVHLGDMATFECEVTVPLNDSVQSYTWIGRTDVQREHRFRYEDNHKIVHILDVNEQDNNTKVFCKVQLESGFTSLESVGTIFVLPQVSRTLLPTKTMATVTPDTGMDLLSTLKTITTNHVSMASRTMVFKTIEANPAYPSPKSTPEGMSLLSTQYTTSSLSHQTVTLSDENTPSVAMYPDSSSVPSDSSKLPDLDSTSTEKSVDVMTHTTGVSEETITVASGGVTEDDDYFFMTSIGGIVTIAIGFIFVITAFFASIQYLRYINKRGHQNKLTRENVPTVLQYDHGSESVTMTLPSSESEQPVIISPISNRRYTPGLNSQFGNHYKSMPSLIGNGDHQDGQSERSSYENTGRSHLTKGSSRMYRTASNYSILTRQSYENLTSTEGKQQAFRESGYQSGSNLV